VAEEPEVVVDEGPDYATLDPSEYGVQDVYFAFDQYDLDDESMGLLSRNARAMKEAARDLALEGVEEVAEGSAELGASDTLYTTAEELYDKADELED